jgi:hypothetical protein
MDLPGAVLTWIKPSDESSPYPNYDNLDDRIDLHARNGDFLSAAVLARRVLCTEVEKHGLHHHETQLTIRQLAVFLKKANHAYEEDANALLALLG